MPRTPVTRARSTGISAAAGAGASRRRGTRAAARPDPAGCRSGTCRRRRAAQLERELLRADWPAATRMPSTKKLPRPTASRMTRVWLPGRPRPITACRSGNQRGARQRAHGADERRARPGAGPARPPRSRPHTIAPTRSDAACHTATATSAALTATRRADLRPVDRRATHAADRGAAGAGRRGRRRAGRRAPRISSSGLTRRTSSSGTSANSSDTSTPTLDPLPARPTRSAP